MHITRINGISVDFSGEYTTLIVLQQDKPGVIAHISNVLSLWKINVAYLRVFRESKGATAYSIVETDTPITSPQILEQIRQNPFVQDVTLITV